jgi:hypothetical protein
MVLLQMPNLAQCNSSTTHDRARSARALPITQKCAYDFVSAVPICIQLVFTLKKYTYICRVPEFNQNHPTVGGLFDVQPTSIYKLPITRIFVTLTQSQWRLFIFKSDQLLLSTTRSPLTDRHLESAGGPCGLLTTWGLVYIICGFNLFKYTGIQRVNISLPEIYSFKVYFKIATDSGFCLSCVFIGCIQNYLNHASSSVNILPV